MAAKFSFQINIDFYHKASCSSNRICCCFSENIQNNVDTYYSMVLLKKDSEAEFDLLGHKMTTIQDLSSRVTEKKNKRRQRTECESDLEEKTQ